MTDETKTDGAPAAKWTSTPALVTWWLLALWSGITVANYSLAAWAVKVDAILQGLISNTQNLTGTVLVAAVSFWVGSTVGARASGDAIAESGKVSAAALAKIAGGAPMTDPGAAPQVVTIQQADGEPVPVQETPTPFMEKPVP
jgi:hypothetical protein